MLYYYLGQSKTFQIDMGNNVQQIIPSNYLSTVHPQLTESSPNQTRNHLQIKIIPGQGFSHWRWNLSPLQSSGKHLLIPCRFIDPSLEGQIEAGCCSESNEYINMHPYIVAQYQPYVYTLENQILLRKMRNLNFKEYQLWKILKAAAFALKDWAQVYPDLPINHCFTPRNILFNSQGHIKIAHRFSFFQPTRQINSPAYLPPSSPFNNNLNDNQTPLSLCIYGLGVTLLETVSLFQSQYSGMSTLVKKQILHKSNIYPLEVKETILGMVEPQPELRIGLKQIFLNISKYKRLSVQK